MASQNYNPGEPVFDQSTGEQFIDEDGNLVEVAPGLKVTNGADTLDGDDVANAAWYRANKFLGETLRAVNIGVPYQQVLGQSDKAQAMTVVLAEVKTCNKHDDCDAADERARGRGSKQAVHCWSEDCEECFGT